MIVKKSDTNTTMQASSPMLTVCITVLLVYLVGTFKQTPSMRDVPVGKRPE